MATPAPGKIPGTTGLDPWNHWMLARLSLAHAMRGWRGWGLGAILGITLALGAYQATQEPRPWPLWWAIGLIVALLLFPVVARLIQHAAWRQHGGWVKGYFDKTATQIVHPAEGRWVLTDHHRAVRGSGRAQPFRRRVFRSLAQQADQAGVDIYMETTVAKLMRNYLEDMPGLDVIDATTSKKTVRYRMLRRSGDWTLRQPPDTALTTSPPENPAAPPHSAPY